MGRGKARQNNRAKQTTHDLHPAEHASDPVFTTELMPAWLHRILLAVCALVSLGVIAGLTVVLSQTRAEYTRVQQTERQVRQRLVEVERRLAEQEIVLERLRTDPAYVEMVIRRRLGFAKPDEFVFRFEE